MKADFTGLERLFWSLHDLIAAGAKIHFGLASIAENIYFNGWVGTVSGSSRAADIEGGKIYISVSHSAAYIGRDMINL